MEHTITLSRPEGRKLMRWLIALNVAHVVTWNNDRSMMFNVEKLTASAKDSISRRAAP